MTPLDATIPDQELLRRFAEGRDEGAFAEVVRRYMDFVYSVAVRVTVNGALAQDATQTVFTKLAQQAGRLSRYDTIVGWLHTTARYAAINLVRGEERRRVREQESFMMHNPSTGPEANWEEIGPLLDEAVGRLTAADQKAVLLRYFKNQSHQEVGTALGLSEEAARKRVERALEKLRGQFAQRGVTATGALLAGAMAANSVQAAPTGLAEKVVPASLAGAGGSAGGIFLKILFMSTKTKLLVAAAVMVAIAITMTMNRPGFGAPMGASKPEIGQPGATTPGKAAPAVSSFARVVGPVTGPAAGSRQPAPVAAVSSVPAATDAAAASPQFTAEPQADLKTAVANAVHFFEVQDTASVLKILMAPQDMEDEMRGKGATTFEELAPLMAKDPAMAQRFILLQSLLSNAQSQTPIISPDGQLAAFIIDPPVEGHKNLEFQKVDGFWYLK